MPGPYPLATLAAQIDQYGISAPPFQDVLASLTATYQGIYGPDAYLEPDSQDGQLLAAFADIINDTNNACIAVYNSFSPSTAVGAGLSSNVKLNGLVREPASNSSVDVQITGDIGTEITNGLVQDEQGYQWVLPALVIISPGNTVTATAVALQPGPITAAPGTVDIIATPTRGWTSVTNGLEATVGASVESDAELRQRQSESTSLPALTPLESIVADIRDLPGVQIVRAYENDTGSPMPLPAPPPPPGEPPDPANMLPGHSIALVVVGGDDVEIATAIANGKLGTGTYGGEPPPPDGEGTCVTVTVIDQNGVPDVINFARARVVPIYSTVGLTPLQGYSSIIGGNIQSAMSVYVDGPAGQPDQGIPIGGSVNLYDLVAASKLPPPDGNTYKVEAGQFTLGTSAAAQSTDDIQLVWYEQASLPPGNVTLTLP